MKKASSLLATQLCLPPPNMAISLEMLNNLGSKESRGMILLDELDKPYFSYTSLQGGRERDHDLESQDIIDWDRCIYDIDILRVR